MSFTPEHFQLWTHPEYYAGEEFPDLYVTLGQHRDSGVLDRSNFRSFLKALGGESDTVRVIRAGHWLVGWIEFIGIHKDDAVALEAADEMAAALKDYPVVDEDDYSELEREEANETWKNCFSAQERLVYIREHSSQFEFRDYADLISNVRGAYFSGYASELLN